MRVLVKGGSMSIWTHVAGCIRVDGFIDQSGSEDGKAEEKISSSMGKIINFADDDYTTIIPCGSEGSLKYKWLRNEHTSAINIGQILIWGDLRDYSNVDEIEKWLTEIVANLEKNHLYLRDGVVSVDAESNDDRFIFSFSGKVWDKISIGKPLE